MKKLIKFASSITLVFCVLLSTYAFTVTAVDNSSSIWSSTEYFEDGSYTITTLEIIDNSPEKGTKTASKTTTHYENNTAVCALKVTGTFYYDGSSVSCTSASHTKYSYNSAWTVEDVTVSRGPTSSAQTYALASGKAKKRNLGVVVKTYSISATVNCDINGNIS